MKEQGKDFDEWNTTDGWGILDSSNSAEPVSVPVPAVKHQGVTAQKLIFLHSLQSFYTSSIQSKAKTEM